MPASTGIQRENLFGDAVMMDVLAIAPEPDCALQLEPIYGLRQKSPYRYGSAFARAHVVSESHARQILISDTASICGEDATIHEDNIRAQVRKTLEVIEAMLAQQGAGLGDLCSATVFFKQTDSIDAYHEIFAEEFVLCGTSRLPAPRFFSAPVPSGCTLTLVLSSESNSIRMRAIFRL